MKAWDDGSRVWLDFSFRVDRRRVTDHEQWSCQIFTFNWLKLRTSPRVSRSTYGSEAQRRNFLTSRNRLITRTSDPGNKGAAGFTLSDWLVMCERCLVKFSCTQQWYHKAPVAPVCLFVYLIIVVVYCCAKPKASNSSDKEPYPLSQLFAHCWLLVFGTFLWRSFCSVCPGGSNSKCFFLKCICVAFGRVCLPLNVKHTHAAQPRCRKLFKGSVLCRICFRDVV